MIILGNSMIHTIKFRHRIDTIFRARLWISVWSIVVLSLPHLFSITFGLYAYIRASALHANLTHL